MKCVGIVIAVVSMLFVALSARADLVTVGQELVGNGGFEDPGSPGALPTGWIKLNNSFESYTSSAHSGSWGVSAYNTGAAYQMRLWDGFASNVTSVAFSGWVRGDGGSSTSVGAGTMSIEVGDWNGSAWVGTPQSVTLSNTGSGTWEDLTASLSVPTGANGIAVTLRNTSWTYAVNFDDISMTAVGIAPEPGTLVLFGTGLIGLICYAWRKRR